MDKFEDRLRKIVYDSKLTQGELSNLTGINQSMISKYISGMNTPTLDRLVRLSKALNISIDYLLTGKKPNPPEYKEFQKLLDRVKKDEISDAEIADIVRGMQDIKIEEPNNWQNIRELFKAILSKKFDDDRFIEAFGKVLGSKKDDIAMRLIRYVFPKI